MDDLRLLKLAPVFNAKVKEVTATHVVLDLTKKNVDRQICRVNLNFCQVDFKSPLVDPKIGLVNFKFILNVIGCEINLNFCVNLKRFQVNIIN